VNEIYLRKVVGFLSLVYVSTAQYMIYMLVVTK
jgi:hypothetical protein